jgi:hypothetical protein
MIQTVSTIPRSKSKIAPLTITLTCRTPGATHATSNALIAAVNAIDDSGEVTKPKSFVVDEEPDVM